VLLSPLQIFLTFNLGSGKTQLCKEFEAAGYNVFDEAFMDMPSVNLHPQSFVMENIWVSRWIQRLLIKQKVIFIECLSFVNNFSHELSGTW
jgi:hypothetical protein